MKTQSLNEGFTPTKWRDIPKFINPIDNGNNSKDIAIANAVSTVMKLMENHDLPVGYFFNEFFAYDETYWKIISKDEMTVFIRDAVKQIYPANKRFHTSAFYKALKETFRDELLEITEVDNDIKLNCRNGTIHFKQGGDFQLKEFNRDDYLTYQLDYEFNEQATCPLWDDFLNEMLPNKDHQMLLHQFIGYAFTRGIKLEKALFLYGDGGNGKSVVQEVVMALLGKENMSSVSIGRLTKDANSIMLIENKLLNYCSENENDINITQFKTLVSGEPILGKKLYSDLRQVTNYAKLMFNLNALPKIKENKDSYHRRLLVLPFNKKPKEVDTELHHKIIKAELDGVFNRVLNALKKLINNKAFIETEEMRDIIRDYKCSADVFNQFLEEEIDKTSGFTSVGHLHENYVGYCKRHGEEYMKLGQFGGELKKRGFERKQDKKFVYYDISGGRVEDESVPF